MIIKCPECGRQVSEKAPTCPTCGVQIAGKITRCSNCGEIYFTEDGMCPSCHTPAKGAYRPAAPVPATPVQAGQQSKPSADSQDNPQGPSPATTRTQQPAGKGPQAGAAPEQPKKKSNGVLIISLLFAVIICGGLFYFYSRAQSDKENEDYEFAMRSTDPEVLQSYLLRYGDAPQAHRDSIEYHLQMLQKGDEEWQNAVLSNSRAALQAYIDHNPESVHRQEALNKIDSLDWISAQKSNDIEAVKDYATQHPDGRYIDEANVLISKLMSTTVQPEEKQMITSLFRQFFQSINSKDESRLISTLSMVIEKFLGKSDATSSDAIEFLHRLYKEGVSNINWHIDQSSYKIDKKEVAEEEFEYSVSFNAREDIERGDAMEQHGYRIDAKVTNDGKISSFNLSRTE